MASTANDWTEVFYDAVSHNGSKIYIQAEMPWQADLSWVDAAKDFAKQYPELRLMLEKYKGELKSKLYFEILNYESAKSYSNLIENMIEGPRKATVFIYDYIEFRKKGLEVLDFSEKDIIRSPEITEDIDEFLAISVLKTSPISDFQNLLTRAKIPNYQPLLNPDFFNASKIANSYKNIYRHVVVVAARTQAVFGSLSELETKTERKPLTAMQKLDELLRMDRAFDRDFEKSLEPVLAGLYELEVGTHRIHSRRANVREEKSEKYSGIQAADVSSAVARNLLEKHDKSSRLVTEKALIDIKSHFYRFYYNGIMLN
jgi:hypothetical protein